MNASRILAVAALSFAAVAAQAETPDLSGQYAVQVKSTVARSTVQADKAQGVSPWSIQYNPLTTFRSQKTRAQVTGDYLAQRDAVAAFTGEDSGAAYLAAHRAAPANVQFAGQPVNAQ